MPDTEARFFGYSDARCYDRCDASQYGYKADSQGEYYEGYGQGMDVNIEVENGIAPEGDRKCGECDSCSTGVTPNTARTAYGAMFCTECFDEITG